MTSISLILVSIVFFLLIFRKSFKWSTYKPEGFPPGPPRIPLIGNYWAILLINYRYLHKAALLLSKYYKTKVLGLWLGAFPTIVINDTELIREAFRSNAFDGKPDVFVARIRSPTHGLHGELILR